MLKSNKIKHSAIVLIFSCIAITLSIFNFMFKSYLYESIFLSLFSSILLVVYVIAFNKHKFSFVFPTIYTFYTVFYIIELVNILEIFNTADMRYFNHRLIGIGYIYIVLSLLFTITAINTFSTKVKKLFPIISVSTSLAVFVVLGNGYLSIIEFIMELVLYRDDKFAYFGTHVLANISSHIALLVFLSKNKLPSVLLNFNKNEKNLTPEQRLKILNDKFEFGVISDEEYKGQREEIISKL